MKNPEFSTHIYVLTDFTLRHYRLDLTEILMYKNSMKNLIELFKTKKRIAVIGATDNPDKYGCKVYRKLKKLGFTVYVTNPRKERIDGDTVYHDPDDISDEIDALSMIVPPVAGLKAVEKAQKKNIKVVWCQPGAESPEIITYCRGNGIDCIYNQCVLKDL